MFLFLLKYLRKPGLNIVPALALIFSGVVISCTGVDDFQKNFGILESGPDVNGQTFGHGPLGDRKISPDTRRVMILYSAGFNNLSSYLERNIEDLKKGFIPENSRQDNVLLVFSKTTAKKSDYGTKTSPVLFRLYKNYEGDVVADTLLIMEKGIIAASANTLKTVLEYIKTKFPAAGYGMVLSSHATGWLPKGYYSNPVSSGFSWDGKHPYNIFPHNKKPGGSGPYDETPVPYIEPFQDPSMPAVKSIAQETAMEGGMTLSYEIELEDFSSAIPMYLDYIIFDACLMGCVEVAHSLKDKCGQIGFSPTEILADGFDYKKLAGRLIGGQKPDVEGACLDYFQQYDTQTGQYRSATVSVVDCSKLDALALVCKELFAKYKEGLASIPASEVQRYFRGNRHWFYDLEDIIVKAGASQEDLSKLKKALEAAVTYKAATPYFLEIEIKTCSGLSMYLPVKGSPFLNNFYKTLSWNKATALVE